MRAAAGLASFLLFVVGCGGGEAPDTPDAAAGADAGAPAPAIECVRPFHGEMVLDETMRALPFVASVRGARGTRATIDGEEVAIDDAGLVRAEIEVRYGINDVEVTVEGTTQLCTFLVAAAYADADDDIGTTALLQIGGEGVDDGDDDTTLGSLDDVLSRAARAGLLTRALDLGLGLVGFDPPVCTGPDPCSMTMDDVSFSRIELDTSTLAGPQESELTVIDGGLRVLARSRDLRLGAHLVGVGTASRSSATRSP